MQSSNFVEGVSGWRIADVYGRQDAEEGEKRSELWNGSIIVMEHLANATGATKPQKRKSPE